MTNKHLRQTINLLITGPHGSGTTEFIHAISQIEVPSGFGVDFGYVDIDDELRVTLFGKQLESQLAVVELSILVETILGFALIVDSTDPETFTRAKALRDAVLEQKMLPYVVAANKQDLAGALPVETLRQALDIAPAIAVLPCVATDHESAKEVLLSLINAILDDFEPGNQTPTVPPKLAD